MFRSLSLVLLLLVISLVFSADLNGIYVLDLCECSSSKEQCEPKGPFIFDQQRSSLAVRYGSIQIGVGTIDTDNRLDLYLNKNRCKGIWNPKNRLAEFKCQQQSGAVCATKLRCVSGTCLETRLINDVPSRAGKLVLSLFSLILLFI